MKHKATTVNLNGKNIMIDNNILEMVLLFNNKVGLKTQYCCENLNNEGLIQILFDFDVTEDEINKFLEDNKEFKYKSIIEIDSSLRNPRVILYIPQKYYTELLYTLYNNYDPTRLYIYCIYLYEYRYNTISNTKRVKWSREYQDIYQEVNLDEFLNDKFKEFSNLENTIINIEKRYYIKYNDIIKCFNSIDEVNNFCNANINN